MTADHGPPRTFRYRRPAGDEWHAGKAHVRLGNTDLVRASVQVLGEHGANNLHSHPRTDGIWFVLSGRCRFYGEDDVTLGELGRHEGITIPRGTKYWFESVGEEPLELLHISATSRPGSESGSDRVDHEPPVRVPGESPVLESGGPR